MEFGEWLKRIRDKLGLTQTQFADVIGLKARETVGKWESNQTPVMRGANGEALLAFLGYSDIEEMEHAWKSQAWPDMELLRSRAGTARAVYRLDRPTNATIEFSAIQSDPAFQMFRAMNPAHIRDALLIAWEKLSVSEQRKAIESATGIAGKISAPSAAPKRKSAAYNMQARGSVKRHAARDPDQPLKPGK